MQANTIIEKQSWKPGNVLVPAPVVLVSCGSEAWRRREGRAPYGADRDRPFVALANVGLFYGIYEPPLVPDVLLSFDVSLPEEVWQKRHRSYFVWEYGKPPELVVEIVSNIKGEEAERKLHTYARIGIAFYVIFDPENYLKQGVLRVYQLSGSVYKLSAPECLTSISLGLTLWHGEYEGLKGTWLRWCDCQGNLLLTGFELNEKERMRTEKAQQQAEKERKKAEQAQQQAEKERKKAKQVEQQAEKERTRAEQAELKNKRLIAQLQKLGIKPEE